jgi:ketosteroid isomerase-like protein
MFSRIVARQVRSVWEALDRRDRGPVLRGFARSFVYENVAAEHAFGGTFRTVEQMEQHFDVLFGLLPDITFEVGDVVVAGNPAATRVVVRVRLSASLPDGSTYVNDLVQHLQLRWGKVTAVRAMVDNVRAQAACDRLAAAGRIAPRPSPRETEKVSR